MRLPAICLFLYACVALYLKAACWRDPTSLFFDPELAYKPGYSAVRIDQAEAYAENDLLSDSPPPAEWDPASRPMICVGMASVERQGVSYLKSTIGSLQAGLSREERARLYFVVLLAHTDQTQHPEVAEPWLAEAVDALPTYHDDPDRLRLARDMEMASSHSLKAKFDYSIVLEECAKVSPHFTMVVEDDVVALDGWFHRTLQALGDASTKTVDMGHMSCKETCAPKPIALRRPQKEEKKKRIMASPIVRRLTSFALAVLYLRLFYYEALRGWNSDEWFRYVRNCAALVFVEVLLIHVARSYRGGPRKPFFDQTTVFLLLVYTPMCIGLFFAAGRNCVLPQCHGVQLMPKYACCGQGLVYPQDRVDSDLIPLFRRSRNSTLATDSFIEDYADRHDELRWAVTPVLLQHVGGRSSHGVPRSQYGVMTAVWLFNFAFETNNAEALAEEHQMVVEGGQGWSV